jgi:folate-binding protein YgfZ
MKLSSLPLPTLPSPCFATLDDLALLTVDGADATSFLHNQLTNDVSHLPIGKWRHAGYCSPKGRLLATLRIWRNDDTVYLQLPRSLATTIHKRLQMFVLRAKARLTDVSDTASAVGLYGSDCEPILKKWFPDLPDIGGTKVSDAGTLMRLADAADQCVYLWITAAALQETLLPSLRADIAEVSSALWQGAQLLAGVPQIDLATTEKFVPQMINYELLGGVDFKKGCYPGQEIVARSQYLGTLKRRMVLAQIEAASVKPGMDIFSAGDPGQPCGTIVNAAPLADPATWLCLTEIKLSALDADSVHLTAPQGALLKFLPLPYSITESVTD